MNERTQRRNLDDYRTASRDIELAEVCISILERVSDPAAQRCIKQLKTAQKRMLRKIDAAAGRLGAPYPGKTGGAA